MYTMSQIPKIYMKKEAHIYQNRAVGAKEVQKKKIFEMGIGAAKLQILRFETDKCDT